jgi:hypothetical protein
VRGVEKREEAASAIDDAVGRVHAESCAANRRFSTDFQREASPMRTFASTLALLFLASLIASADDAPANKSTTSPNKEDASRKNKEAPLKVGNELPGPFHPYNVTGENKQRFHCLVSEHGLEPTVLIFYKNVDNGDPLPNLLKRLDAAIAKNPDSRLGAFVVFVPDDLPDVTGSKEKDAAANSKNDDARLELEKKVEAIASDLKLKNVVLCLDDKSDVAKYQLDDANEITIVLYSKLKVVAVYALPKSDFTEAAVEKVLADVADKLGAKRK